MNIKVFFFLGTIGIIPGFTTQIPYADFELKDACSKEPLGYKYIRLRSSLDELNAPYKFDCKKSNEAYATDICYPKEGFQDTIANAPVKEIILLYLGSGLGQITVYFDSRYQDQVVRAVTKKCGPTNSHNFENKHEWVSHGFLIRDAIPQRIEISQLKNNSGLSSISIVDMMYEQKGIGTRKFLQDKDNANDM